MIRKELAFLALVLIAAAAIGRLAWWSLRAICWHTPPAALPASDRPVTAPSRAPRARPRRVVLLVLDGLRLDVSREMPFVRELRSRGVDAVARSPEPSLSRPSYATMATGAEPARSGVRNNSFRDEVSLDTVFDRVQAGHFSTAGAANLSWWHENFRRGIGQWFRAGREPDEERDAMVRALETPADLVLIHLVDLDHVAHHEGVHREYRETARQLSDTLAGVFSRFDYARDAIVLVSDHGHRDRGGHGGPEPEVVRVPLVIAGKGVRHGVELGDAGSVGVVGPTIATLLGVELPRDATSEPLVAALDPEVLGAEYLQARLDDARSERRAYDARLGARRQASDAARLAGIWPLDASSGELPGSALGRALAALLLLGGGSWAIRRARRRNAQLALALLPLALAGPVAAMRLADLPWSLSAIVRVDLLVEVLALGVLAGVVLHVLALASVARRADDFAFQLRVGAVAYLALAPLLWLATGYRHPLSLPWPPLLFAPLALAFVGGTTAVAFGAVNVVWAWRWRAGSETRSDG